MLRLIDALQAVKLRHKRFSRCISTRTTGSRATSNVGNWRLECNSQLRVQLMETVYGYRIHRKIVNSFVQTRKIDICSLQRDARGVQDFLVSHSQKTELQRLG
ncbi:hypothetical protein AVEN_210148-1 [Araneus ventricosus]|uniref:Uncharacterized protein n=2 Tax=Araneus ventricosus TaxID=182803 RepID=A0A4Y2L080_ARAVE|nr:hypothetical protein AVEN_170365-1 [Araneus ventricosus]GBN07283.1 hypothetical protein AVEN_210148-1 [Araneus ventricosus]